MEAVEFLEPNEVAEYHIEMAPRSNAFLIGHGLRVEISNSNFPHFDGNLSTGEDILTGSRIEAARQTVLHDAHRPTHILLPVIPRA